MLIIAADTEVTISGTAVIVGWRGQPVLRGAARVEPGAGHIAISAAADGDAVHITVRVDPQPGTAIGAAWLAWHWVAPVPARRAWVPHLRPQPDDVVAEHSFRSPVAALESNVARVVLLADVDLLAHSRVLPAAFDLDLTDTRGARIGYG